MTIEIKNLENFSYEQPSLKKYGTMKEFTLGSGGSGIQGSNSDGRRVNNNNIVPDPNDPSGNQSQRDRTLHDSVVPGVTNNTGRDFDISKNDLD